MTSSSYFIINTTINTVLSVVVLLVVYNKQQYSGSSILFVSYLVLRTRKIPPNASTRPSQCNPYQRKSTAHVTAVNVLRATDPACAGVETLEKSVPHRLPP